MTKAPLYRRLIAAHPLPKPGAALAALSSAYARKAGDAGTEGPWWRVWRAIERARGHRLRAAVRGLQQADRRWLALWSFERGRLREGIVVYRMYLADPGAIGPFGRETAAFLRHVLAVHGASKALAEAEKLSDAARANALVAGVVAELLTPAELLARSAEPTGAHVHDGAAWARRAIALARNGDAGPARTALERTAKLGLRGAGPETERALLEAFALSPEAWAELRKPWAPAVVDDLADLWRSDRGARVAPAEHSPHAFGGADFELPLCRGCGHREHQFFVFEVASIPDLASRIPSWPKLPLIACLDCAMWLTRRDYRINSGRIEPLGGAVDPSTAYGTLEPLARGPVAVVPIPADAPPGADRTQVGGAPDWVQRVERAFCPCCWDELVFVAALGSTYGDDWIVPEFMVNNGSGYQYFFACNACEVLSVFGQNT